MLNCPVCTAVDSRYVLRTDNHIPYASWFKLLHIRSGGRVQGGLETLVFTSNQAEDRHSCLDLSGGDYCTSASTRDQMSIKDGLLAVIGWPKHEGPNWQEI